MANSLEETAGANVDQKDAVSPAGLSTRIPQGDGSLTADDEETQSPEPSRTNAGSSSETLDMPSLGLDGTQRHPLTAAASPSRHTLRHVQTPPGYHQDDHDRIFAALVLPSRDAGNWRLRDALSQDLAALETALQDLLWASSGSVWHANLRSGLRTQDRWRSTCGAA
jgi:hypothetical protein